MNFLIDFLVVVVPIQNGVLSPFLIPLILLVLVGIFKEALTL